MGLAQSFPSAVVAQHGEDLPEEMSESASSSSSRRVPGVNGVALGSSLEAWDGEGETPRFIFSQISLGKGWDKAPVSRPPNGEAAEVEVAGWHGELDASGWTYGSNGSCCAGLPSPVVTVASKELAPGRIS